jgi:hypothetical protein
MKYNKTLARHLAEPIYASFSDIQNSQLSIEPELLFMTANGDMGGILTIFYVVPKDILYFSLTDFVVGSSVDGPKPITNYMPKLRQYFQANPDAETIPENLEAELRLAYQKHKQPIIDLITRTMTEMPFGTIEGALELDHDDISVTKDNAKEMLRICEILGFYPDYNNLDDNQKTDLTIQISQKVGQTYLRYDTGYPQDNSLIPFHFSNEWAQEASTLTAKLLVRAIQETLKELFGG